MRLQARRGNGRFTRNTMENTFGLTCHIHERKADGTWCGALNPTIGTLDKLATALQRAGRKVGPMDLVPRRQPVLIKGARALRNGKKTA